MKLSWVSHMSRSKIKWVTFPASLVSAGQVIEKWIIWLILLNVATVDSE